MTKKLRIPIHHRYQFYRSQSLNSRVIFKFRTIRLSVMARLDFVLILELFVDVSYSKLKLALRLESQKIKSHLIRIRKKCTGDGRKQKPNKRYYILWRLQRNSWQLLRHLHHTCVVVEQTGGCVCVDNRL